MTVGSPILETRPARAGMAEVELPSVIDLFAGCGGLSLGMQQAGFEVVAGFDNWDPALEVYNRNMNHPGYKLDLGDLKASLRVLSPWMSQADVIVGGPPCQDFSSAGNRIEAAKADLTEKYASIVTALTPKAFVMENVERAKDARVYLHALTMLREAGYGITKIVLDASLVGVPQKRKRLFAVGIFGGEEDALRESLIANLDSQPMTIRRYFGDKLGIEHYYRHPRSYARRAVFSIDEPSATIRGVNRPVPPGYPGHPGDTIAVHEGLRPLTTSERAMVQTFPASFDFGRTKTAAEQMIGNAVPVRLGQYVGERLAEHITTHRL